MYKLRFEVTHAPLRATPVKLLRFAARSKTNKRIESTAFVQ